MQVSLIESHNQVFNLFKDEKPNLVWIRADSHADMHPTNDFSDYPNDLDIGNFVLPLCRKNIYLNDIYWIHNEVYSKEFDDGYYEFKYGVSKDFKLPCISYINKEFAGYCDKEENLIQACKIKLHVNSLIDSVRYDLNDKDWILDIDCDFFSCTHFSYQYLLQNKLLDHDHTKFILSLFKRIEISNILDQNIFKNFRNSNMLWILKNIPKSQAEIKKLTDIISEIEKINGIFIEYLNHLWNYYTYPFFVATENQISYDIELFFSKLNFFNLNKRRLRQVSICKSSNDLFTPLSQVDFIVDKLLKKLDNYLEAE